MQEAEAAKLLQEFETAKFDDTIAEMKRQKQKLRDDLDAHKSVMRLPATKLRLRLRPLSQPVAQCPSLVPQTSPYTQRGDAADEHADEDHHPH